MAGFVAVYDAVFTVPCLVPYGRLRRQQDAALADAFCRHYVCLTTRQDWPPDNNGEVSDAVFAGH